MNCIEKQVDVYNYCTAVSCTNWHVKESVLYLIRLEMGTHCRDRRTKGSYASRIHSDYNTYSSILDLLQAIRPFIGRYVFIKTNTRVKTITIYFIHPSGKLKLSSDRTTKNISQ